jgi:hypothetical protein
MEAHLGALAPPLESLRHTLWSQRVNVESWMLHCKKAMSECAKFRCGQRWRRTKGRGSRNFPTLTSFGLRHRCPHRNFTQLFLQCKSWYRRDSIRTGLVLLENNPAPPPPPWGTHWSARGSTNLDCPFADFCGFAFVFAD